MPLHLTVLPLDIGVESKSVAGLQLNGERMDVQMGDPCRKRWTLTMTIVSALLGGLAGVALGCLGTMSVWWLIGIVRGHGADGNVSVFFYGFFFVFLCGCGGFLLAPPLTRRWWEKKSPLRF